MEAVKNTVSNLLGHNKEATTTEETSQHHHSGHHEQRDDHVGGTTDTSSTPTVHDQTTSPSDLPSKTTSATDTGISDHHARSNDGENATSDTPGHHETHEHHSHKTEGGKRVQSPDQGPDPALVGDATPKGGKLTGTGEPGSHSALFGLTPDGKKNTETSSGSGAPVAAHSKDSAVGGGKQSAEGDTGSRAPAGGDELRDQLHKADRDDGQTVGRRADPMSLSGEDGGAKPGAGATGGGQGTGDI